MPVVAAPVFVPVEVAAHARSPLADCDQAFEHRVDEFAVLLEVRAPLRGDGVELLGALVCAVT